MNVHHGIAVRYSIFDFTEECLMFENVTKGRLLGYAKLETVDEYSTSVNSLVLEIIQNSFT